MSESTAFEEGHNSMDKAISVFQEEGGKKYHCGVKNSSSNKWLWQTTEEWCVHLNSYGFLSLTIRCVLNVGCQTNSSRFLVHIHSGENIFLSQDKYIISH